MLILTDGGGFFFITNLAPGSMYYSGMWVENGKFVKTLFRKDRVRFLE